MAAMPATLNGLIMKLKVGERQEDRPCLFSGAIDTLVYPAPELLSERILSKLELDTEHKETRRWVVALAL